jgi:hypothetical protein
MDNNFIKESVFLYDPVISKQELISIKLRIRKMRREENRRSLFPLTMANCKLLSNLFTLSNTG